MTNPALSPISYQKLLTYAIQQTPDPEALAAGILVGLCESYPDELAELASILPPELAAESDEEINAEQPRLRLVGAELQPPPVRPPGSGDGTVPPVEQWRRGRNRNVECPLCKKWLRKPVLIATHALEAHGDKAFYDAMCAKYSEDAPFLVDYAGRAEAKA